MWVSDKHTATSFTQSDSLPITHENLELEVTTVNSGQSLMGWVISPNDFNGDTLEINQARFNIESLFDKLVFMAVKSHRIQLTVFSYGVLYLHRDGVIHVTMNTLHALEQYYKVKERSGEGY